MIWALLAVLGVPIWLVVGMLILVFVSRRRFAAIPGVFVCRVRPASGRDRWPRSTRHARWVHDVLLVHGGPGRLQSKPLGVTGIVDGVRTSDARFRGAAASVAIVVRTDDGAAIEVASPATVVDLLQGPFTEAG